MTVRSAPFWVLFFVALGFGGAVSAGNGLVALQTADPSCPDDSGDRYVDCGNGTVTDNQTGLVWLANANCFGDLDWHQAVEIVANLSDLPGGACGSVEPDECDCGLSDGSSPGEWRLPSMAERVAMIEHADDVLQCSPTISNDAGGDCWDHCWDQECVDTGACSFYDVQWSIHWSSSSMVSSPTAAWVESLVGGYLHGNVKSLGNSVWPVRGGQ